MCAGTPICGNLEWTLALMKRAVEIHQLEGISMFDALERADDELRVK